MTLISIDLDRRVSSAAGTPPIATMTPQSPAVYTAARKASLANPDFKLQVVQYLNEVSVRVQAHRLRTAGGNK